MKTLNRISLCLLLFLGNQTFAQHLKPQLVPTNSSAVVEKNVATKSSIYTSSVFKEIIQNKNENKWAIKVRPVQYRKHYAPDVEAIKAAKAKEKKFSNINSESANALNMPVTPQVGINFEANWSITSTPPDNSMAISNGGFIVTTNNDGVEYYNANGTILLSDSWTNFFNTPALTGNIYDPKVIYDSGADRFVMTVLHGTKSNNSLVLICFSKSNNPQDGWWSYSLPGNALNNNCWFDYPAMGVSTNEIYITGNLFSDNDVFNQAIIYQISKANGYAGNNLNFQHWSGLTSSAFTPSTLMPASYGHQGIYGPGIYLVSSSSGGSDKVVLWDLTNDINANPQLNSIAVTTTSSYSPSPDAAQQGNADLLDNGDCRVQNAFYLNGILHFVLNSDIGQAWNGIFYGRADLSNQTCVTSKFGNAGFADYSFPAAASFSTNPANPSTMIAFLSSAPNKFPEVRVVNCDNNMQWGTSTLVKAGDAFVNMLQGNERWGDYTGIARKHNSTDARVWLGACYGGNIPSKNANNVYLTRVAEIFSNSVGVNTVENTSNPIVFPNPVLDMFTLNFNVVNTEKIKIEILSIEGKLVKLLFEDYPKQGENKLSFNKGALPDGTYFIKISSSSNILKNEKISIHN